MNGIYGWVKHGMCGREKREKSMYLICVCTHLEKIPEKVLVKITTAGMHHK